MILSANTFWDWGKEHALTKKWYIIYQTLHEGYNHNCPEEEQWKWNPLIGFIQSLFTLQVLMIKNS